MITLSAAVLGFTLIFAASVLIFMNSFYYEINMKSLENTAKTLMAAAGNDRLNAIFSHNEENQDFNFLPLGADDVYRLTLIAPSGFVLWDSHVSDRLVNHIDREEVIAALEGKEGSSRRESISTGMKRIYYSLPVFNGGSTIGVFRLSISIPGFWARISPVLIPFTVFFCLFLLAAFWAIIAYSRSLSASFGRLVNIVRPSAPLLSGLETSEPVSPEFLSLEKTLRAMTQELNLRFEQAKSEGSRLEAILNGMSEAVFAMDNSLKLHLVNPKAKEIFYLADNNDIPVLKENTLTLLEATRSTELTDIAKKAVSSGVPFETELTFHAGLSGTKHFQVYASPLVRDNNADNDSGGAVLVLQEITRLVKLEKIRKDFVANVSHELRTPIQLIKGFSETLLDAEKMLKENIHFVDIIHKNAIVMENLTNDLLMLSSLENADTRDMEDCQIAALINEAVSSVEPQARKKKIEIIVKCNEDFSAVLYGSLIIQALINLIDNGIKYSPAKSKIWVNAFMSGESDLIFEVRDKGIGIPSEHLERIFERFYRVDRREKGGTGLGLSIVRHIALLHNGNAEAESHAGKGSVFRIIIPSKNMDHNNHH
jgi:two-component system phosphate regulon sensor histidine kinase PhoR